MAAVDAPVRRLRRASTFGADASGSPDADGPRRRRQLAAVLLLGALWCAAGSFTSLLIAGRLPADRLSTGRIAETALGSQVESAGALVCVVGCIGITVWNILRDPTIARPLGPLVVMVSFFATLALSHLVASGGEIRSGSRIALLLAVTIWAIQPQMTDLRVIGVAGLLIVVVSLGLMPSGKAWMPSSDVVLQEKALIGTHLLAGPFGQSNVMAMALALSLPFVFLFQRRWARLLSFAVLSFFLVLTGGRSSIIGVAAAVAVAVVVLGIRDRFLAGVVATVGAAGLIAGAVWLPLSTTDPQAFTQRGSIWMISRSTWFTTDQTFLFGNGLGYYGIGGHFAVFDHGSPTYHGHNQLVSIMTTSGVISVVAFLVIVAVVVAGACRRRGPGRRTAFFAIFVVIGCGVAETPLRIDTVDALGWLSWVALFGTAVALSSGDRGSQPVGLPLSVAP